MKKKFFPRVFSTAKACGRTGGQPAVFFKYFPPDRFFSFGSVRIFLSASGFLYYVNMTELNLPLLVVRLFEYLGARRLVRNERRQLSIAVVTILDC